MQKKILIIDDDYSLRTVMLKALRTSKITIKTASTISEGWFLLEKEDFDLVICDVVLPDGDGLELIKKLKKKFNHLEFIIISAQNNILTAIKSLTPKIIAIEILLYNYIFYSSRVFLLL